MNKTWERVVSRYYWSNMKNDISEWVDLAARKDPPVSRATLGCIIDPEVPFDKIGIDFLGPLTETTDGNRHLLVITDYATRWIEAFPTKDQKAATVASRHGAPKVLHSNKGRQFLSVTMREVCGYFGNKQTNTTSYHPQCNGLTERFNSTLCQMLSMYVNTRSDAQLPSDLDNFSNKSYFIQEMDKVWSQSIKLIVTQAR